jgi:hypothetical protein
VARAAWAGTSAGSHVLPVPRRASATLLDVQPNGVPRWRQLLLGLLGYPGDGEIPTRGSMRWAMIGAYGAIAVFVALIVVALLFG